MTRGKKLIPGQIKSLEEDHAAAQRDFADAQLEAAATAENTIPLHKHFQQETYQQFSSRTSTSVISRNAQIAAAARRAKPDKRKKGSRDSEGGTLIPETLGTYCKTLLCTHAQPYLSRSTGKRQHSKIRSTKCTAKVNARVKTKAGGNGFYIALNASGAHNHPVTSHQWYDYAENRQVDDPELRRDVAAMRKAGARPRGILEYLRKKTGSVIVAACKRTNLRDVHNMLQVLKQQCKGDLNDAQRALAVLDEFCEQAGGNTAEFFVDYESQVVRVVTFQTAKQKRLFKAFPEIVLVDSTHATNKNRYKL
ncbi:hypothetical protein BBJ28_00001272, partial [Nothophytophthora sp. Chile5]